MIDFARFNSPQRDRRPAARRDPLPSRPPPAAGPATPAASPRLEDVQARRRELAGLGDEIARLSARIEAATYRLLAMIADFDASEGWYEEGFRSCAAWLSWRTGIAPGPAREKVRVARALRELPELSAALGSGRLSYSVARAITRVATPETDAEWVELARHASAAQLERLVCGWQAAVRSRERESERHADRALWVMPEADGSWRIQGRLDPEVGAVLCRALEAAGEVLRGQETDAVIGAAARRADALGLIAEAALGTGLGAESGERPVVGRAERFQVVVHVSAETLAGSAHDNGGESRPLFRRGRNVADDHLRTLVSAETSSEDTSRLLRENGTNDQLRSEVSAETSRAAVKGSNGTGSGEPDSVESALHPADLRETPRVEGGPCVSEETARRLACDSAVVEMTRDRDGSVLDAGRRRRTVPTPLRRVLAGRDGGCRFPGCGVRFCDAHHVRHWAEGGETTLDNLLLLCRHHHRRVHEDGWTVTLDDETGETRFHRPDGRLIPNVPEPPPVPLDPLADLEQRQEDLEIDPWTATPRWSGERLDLDWTLSVLGGRWVPEHDVSAETSAETSCSAYG